MSSKVRWRGVLGVGAAVLAALVLVAGGAARPRAASPKPTLVVVVLGGGRVLSRPAAISCPSRCRATFAKRTRVVLTPKPKKGSRFLRWGGSCTGARACRVTVSALSAVAAQFTAASKPPPSGGGGGGAVAGSYTGSNGQTGNGFTLYVPPGGRTVLNVTDPGTGLSCTNGSGASDHFRILRTAINADGSFSARSSSTGVFRGLRATFTSTVVGRFLRPSAGNPARAAGTWREDLTTSDTTVRCTSNVQQWTATRETGPTLSGPVILAGDYSGSNGQTGNGFTFSVSSDRKTVLNLRDPGTGLACTSSAGAADHLQFDRIAINADGSFSATASDDGLYRGQAAKFTYKVSGFFEGPTFLGAATVAGTWREDMELPGSATLCTSNEQIWNATRTP